MVAIRMWLVVVGVLVAAIADVPSATGGTVPGKNGVLVFDAVDAATKTVQIFQVSAVGAGLKQLTTTTGSVWNEDPSFSADAKRIYFDSLDRSTSAPSHVYRMSASGTSRQLADRVSAPTHVWPSINSSGSALAVVEYDKGGQAVIATMKTDGTNRKVVANATRLQGNGGPEYAPKDGRIAFFRVTYNKNGQGVAKSDLFVRSGKRNTDITANNPAQFFSPSWAPNGRTLVAIRGLRTIVSMRPNGTGVHVLTSVSGADTAIVDAVYSPDGKRIAYVQCTGDCGDPFLQGQGSIWVMNANGSGKRRVFNGGSMAQPASRVTWGVS